MNATTLTKLVEHALHGKLYFDDPERQLYDGLIADAKTRRDLVKEGLLVKDDDKFRLARRVYEEIPEESPDLVADYDARFDAERRSTARPLLRLVSYAGLALAPPRAKYMLEHPDEYQWYVARCEDLNRDWSVAVEGPLTLADARLGVRGKFQHEIVASSEALIQHAVRRVNEARVELIARQNLRWGLQELGILEEQEADKFYIGTSVFPGADKSTGSLLGDVKKAVDHHLREIRDSQAHLDRLIRVYYKVSEIGEEAFRTKFLEAIRQQMEPTTVTDVLS